MAWHMAMAICLSILPPKPRGRSGTRFERTTLKSSRRKYVKYHVAHLFVAGRARGSVCQNVPPRAGNSSNNNQYRGRKIKAR